MDAFEKAKHWFKKRKKRKIIKILSIDGGGMRGIIPAMVMAKIEELTKTPISQLFDLVAGTSTGGILALGVAMPNSQRQPAYSSKDWRDIYINNGPEIFSYSRWNSFKSLGFWLDKKYSSEGIEKVLDNYFGQTKFKDALTNVLITSYEIQHRSLYLFKSRLHKHQNLLMQEIARATSAAPTYFEPAKITLPETNEHKILIDGGVVVNNPSMYALAEAKTLFPDADDFILVSLGTGQYPLDKYTYEQAKSWGTASWIRPIIDVLFHGASINEHQYMESMLPPDELNRQRYYRFQVDVTKEYEPLDNTDPTDLENLCLLAQENIIQKYKKELIDLCSRLLEK